MSWEEIKEMLKNVDCDSIKHEFRDLLNEYVYTKRNEGNAERIGWVETRLNLLTEVAKEKSCNVRNITMGMESYAIKKIKKIRLDEEEKEKVIKEMSDIKKIEDSKVRIRLLEKMEMELYGKQWVKEIHKKREEEKVYYKSLWDKVGNEIIKQLDEKMYLSFQELNKLLQKELKRKVTRNETERIYRQFAELKVNDEFVLAMWIPSKRQRWLWRTKELEEQECKWVYAKTGETKEIMTDIEFVAPRKRLIFKWGSEPMKKVEELCKAGKYEEMEKYMKLRDGILL